MGPALYNVKAKEENEANLRSKKDVLVMTVFKLTLSQHHIVLLFYIMRDNSVKTYKCAFI